MFYVLFVLFARLKFYLYVKLHHPILSLQITLKLMSFLVISLKSNSHKIVPQFI
jgi:hypothetical protein